MQANLTFEGIIDVYLKYEEIYCFAFAHGVGIWSDCFFN